MPTVLSGGNDNFGGRFGTAIAAAGDLNQDGFNDIIVGAPYLEGNRGAVFVFHGTRQGINPVIQQVFTLFFIIRFVVSAFGALT